MGDAKSRPVSLPPEAAAGFGWTNEGPARVVIAALEAARPGGARFVGGCVRDGLVGVTAKDIDIATQLTPDETLAALATAGVRAEPTGVEHGTITAVVDGEGVEVTSLRADVATDGRRAVVSFTDDWCLDAVRRDFTINAIYLTPDLRLYDPWDGMKDLRAGVVRFIGDPTARIREDYLRILRFFRFSARFAKGDYDAMGLAACSAHSAGINGLSRERVGQEMARLIEGPNAAGAVSRMAATGVLARVWGDDADVATFTALKRIWPDAPFAIGLAALWPNAAPDGRGNLASAFRLSNANAARMRAAADNAGSIDAPPDSAAARRLGYRVGIVAACDALRLAAALGKVSDAGAVEKAFDAWTPPSFPIGGGDLVAAGLSPGPDVGKILERIEHRWVAENFPDARRARDIMADEIARIRK